MANNGQASFQNIITSVYGGEVPAWMSVSFQTDTCWVLRGSQVQINPPAQGGLYYYYLGF